MVAILAAVLIIGGLFYFFQVRSHVPKEFLAARNQAVGVAEEIVKLSSESSDNLESISVKDRSGKYEEALDLVLQEANRNAELRNRAVTLSEDLRIMATNLAKVRPKEAAQVGLQAVTSELELVQRLVNYNSYTYELLGVLQTRLESNGSVDAREKIKIIITNMNKEVEKINELNQRYKNQMQEFDRLTR